MLEHGAYNLLIDRYYAREEGIPADQVYKVARAKTREEKEAVDAVLSEFFNLIDGVWRKGRIDEEIAKYHDKQPKLEEKRENDRERQQRSRDRRKKLFQTLKDLGVTMPFTATTDELQDELSRVALLHSHSDVTPPVTRDNTANHTPDTSPQTPVKVKKAPRKTRLPPDFAVSDRVKRWAAEKGYTNLDAHFENFVGKAKAKGYTYVDWDEALMTAIRENWARLGNVPYETHQRPDNSAVARVDRAYAHLDDDGESDDSEPRVIDGERIK